MSPFRCCHSKSSLRRLASCPGSLGKWRDSLHGRVLAVLAPKHDDYATRDSQSAAAVELEATALW